MITGNEISIEFIDPTVAKTQCHEYRNEIIKQHSLIEGDCIFVQCRVNDIGFPVADFNTLIQNSYNHIRDGYAGKKKKQTRLSSHQDWQHKIKNAINYL